MTQQQIYDFLRRHKYKWFRASDIRDALRLSRNSVDNALKRMRKYEEVVWLKPFKEFPYQYRFKPEDI